GSNFGGSPIAISLLGYNVDELKAATEDLKIELAGNKALKDINDNDPEGIKEIKIKLKDKAYALGLNLQSVISQVRSGYFGFQAQRFQRGQDEIKVWVRYTREDRSSIKKLDEMWISTPSGSKVAFGEIATYEIERGVIAINHLNGKREIQVNADLKNPSESATEVLSDIQQNAMPVLFSKYPTITASYEGQNRDAMKTQVSLKKVGWIMIMLIYIVIAFTFRSYTQPLLLMLMIPFSVIGIVIGHYVHDFHINVLSWLGIIALVGIMVNDGLVLIEKFNGYLKTGVKFEEALIHAGQSRFRAIFLTSLTTVAGLAPLLLEKSRQAQFLKPMAVSITYGIIVATVLTLLMLPLLLSLGNTIKVNWIWFKTGTKPTREEVERAIIELKSEENEQV
ncbi:MAG: efflux RND transporter permease subunit, partial [Flavobacteriaceae bacterium]|nr:efflux RND transporter permease subunit [Flavobacteriaceae bacterium]